FTACQFFAGDTNFFLAGRIAMTVMLTFTAIGHFCFRQGMANMIPPRIPFKKELVSFTGIFELCCAAGLLVPFLVKATALLLMLFFICVLPANISASRRNIDYQTGKADGSGPRY